MGRERGWKQVLLQPGSRNLLTRHLGEMRRSRRLLRKVHKIFPICEVTGEKYPTKKEANYCAVWSLSRTGGQRNAPKCLFLSISCRSFCLFKIFRKINEVAPWMKRLCLNLQADIPSDLRGKNEVKMSVSHFNSCCFFYQPLFQCAFPAPIPSPHHRRQSVAWRQWSGTPITSLLLFFPQKRM